MADTKNAQLMAWLEDQGHTPQEIDRIMAKVAEYDSKTVHESVWDSIDSGAFDLGTIISEALNH